MDEFDFAAAGLRADGSDLMGFLEVLGAKLEQALPSQTTVRRRSRRWRGKDKDLRRIEVRLGSTVYVVAVENPAAQAWREREVGGISIKREELELSAWVAALTAELHVSAQTSAEARGALDALLG